MNTQVRKRKKENCHDKEKHKRKKEKAEMGKKDWTINWKEIRKEGRGNKVELKRQKN